MNEHSPTHGSEPTGARAWDAFPASPLQQQLWRSSRRSAAPDHIVATLGLSGKLSRAALQAALDGVVARHEALRTTFRLDGAELLQVVGPTEVGCPLVVQKVSDAALRRQAARQEALTPFDLSAGPLIRARLLQASREEHVLLLTLHRLIADTASAHVLIREASALYGAFVLGRPHRLPRVDAQYADLSCEQRKALTSDALDKQLQFWKQELSLAIPTQPLRERARAQACEAAIDVVRFKLPAGLVRRLIRFARLQRVSLFVTLFTGWSTLIARWFGQNEVVIATQLSRSHDGSRPVGPLENTVLIRVEQHMDPPVDQLLRGAKAQLEKAYEHQDLPVETILEDLHLPDLASLTRVQMNANEGLAGAADVQFPGLKLERMQVEATNVQFDLSLSLTHGRDGLTAAVEYACDLFDKEQIKRMTACWQELLKGMAKHDRRPIGRIAMTPPAERTRAMGALSGAERAYPREQPIHRLFEAQVQRTPESPAVVCGPQSLTYRELDERANQLARCLRARGVAPDQLVGLCIERSLEMMIAILGVWKAGGAYVPLDPDYPRDRLAYMLQDAKPRVLLIQEHLRRRMPTVASPAEILAIDSQWPHISQLPRGRPASAADDVRSDHLAYVIYTSGSTGQPKGVMVEHRNVVSFWQGLEEIYRQCAACMRIGVNASLNFDASVQQIVQALSGRTLVIVPQAIRSDPDLLLKFIDEQRINGVDCTPSQLRAWIAAGLLERRSGSLRLVLVGGEAIDRALWDQLANSAVIDFYNVYGPTETTVDATFARLQGDASAPHIGRPLENRRVYLLDAQLQPVPLGAQGEICIGGAGVARGYLNRPELTAERFIPDPFCDDPGACFYRTGDLGRWRSDGVVEYLGRNDSQVKIRGFRIELGEIETQLSRHPRVKDAVVLARHDASGDRRLVAYVTGRNAAMPSIQAMRDHLSSILPEHMVPTAFVMLEKLPLSPSGKLDRGALPAPDVSAYSNRPYEAPATAVETELATVWRELLHVERVGRNDSFFELGGHSLLIAQMIGRLRRRGWSVDVRQVFRGQSLAELAAALTRADDQDAPAPPNLIPAECQAITPEMLTLVQLDRAQIDAIAAAAPGGAANVEDIYPLAPLQEGMLFHHLLDEQVGETYILSLLFAARSRERLQALIDALQTAIDRHDVLRTAVFWDELPRPVQVVYRKAALPVEQVALDAERDGAEQARQWLDRVRPIDLRRAPLLRLQIAGDPRSPQWYALLQVHHLASDNESLEVLLAELSAHMEDRGLELPQPAPYRNHVAWALAHAERSDAEAAFRLKLGAVDEPTAPFDLGDVHRRSGRIREARRTLDAELAEQVRSQARRMGVSAAALFHAAWGVLIARASDRDDVVFGTVLLGRLQAGVDLRHALGMFINTLPLRLRLQGVSAAELVTQVHSELADLVSLEQTSLAVAQRCSGVSRPGSLFSALVNYRHSSPTAAAARSIAAGVRLLAVQDRTNYPMSLSVDDAGDAFVLTAKIDQELDPQRILAQVSTLLRSLTAALAKAPHTPALTLPVLPEQEWRLVVYSPNDTTAAYPDEKLLHEIFEEQVRRRPGAAAVICEQRSLTFAELNERANRLARCLRAHGVGPDQLVGVCVERSLELMIAILGVWKAGGAYAPLDPDYPRERLAYMLRDAAPRVLLIQEHLREQLPPDAHAAEIIALDSDWAWIARYAGSDLGVRALGVRSDHLAYVIYTSGSTGQPKGVMVEHRNVASLWQGLEHIYRQSAACTRIGVNASFNFDASVKQLIQVLSGRTVVIVPQAIRSDPHLLLQFIDEQRIDGIDCTPSQLRAWIAEGLLHHSGHALRVVLVGGEAIDPPLWDQLAKSAVTDFYNVYGPTESTVDAAFARLRGDASAPHIGRPMENRRIYLLDARLQPVPLGAKGEICIGGAGVARGYLNRPDLTAERFIPDPFSHDARSRLYRSGDMGRWRADGMLTYAGRNDDQVKIRGFRIELGEIEARLASHEDVAMAAVVARKDASGEERLIAYVEPRPGRICTSEALRAHVQASLPQYMTPSAFVAIEALPLTPGGKVNRRALAALEVTLDARQSEEPPQGEVEEILARIWEQLLGLERVSRRDDFFSLGGHSLSAMQLIVRIRSQLALDIPVSLVFKRPVLAELAAHLETQLDERLQEHLAAGDPEIEELLEELAAMPEREAQTLLRKRTVGGKA